MNKEDWDKRYAGTDLLWSVEPNRFLVEETASLPPGRALDLATGEGRNAVWLAEQGWSVDAVDFSAVALAKARRLAEARGVELNWIEADVEQHSPTNGEYDLAIVFYLHLPWERMRHVLHGAAEAVAPQGTLLVVGHDRTNLDRGHGGPKDPDVLYTPEEVAGELPGLLIEEAARRDRLVDTETGVVTAIDCLVRASRPGIDSKC
jgi:2-polyprenyl-3-methyl-5-hydroxy-6-metoxy-1,4-benzoquinol methylase